MFMASFNENYYCVNKQSTQLSMYHLMQQSKMLVRKHKNIYNRYFNSIEITVYSSYFRVLLILNSQLVDMLMVSGNVSRSSEAQEHLHK
jgi:hypothetical protein